jgi:hypothetical protein
MLDVTLILIRVLMGAVGYAARQEKFGDLDAIRPGIVEDRIDTDATPFLCPGTGSLRLGGGKIFSSKALPLALKIVRDY